jgi:hypothetical protein
MALQDIDPGTCQQLNPSRRQGAHKEWMKMVIIRQKKQSFATKTDNKFSDGSLFQISNFISALKFFMWRWLCSAVLTGLEPPSTFFGPPGSSGCPKKINCPYQQDRYVFK